MKHLNKMGSKTLTSSRGDTHANHSRLLENKELKKIRDISGQKCLDLSKNVGQLGSLEKMLVATLNSVLIQLSRTWKVKRFYSTRTFNIPGSGVGALHQRQRIWIISHTNEYGSHQEKRNETEQSSDWEKDRVSIRNGNSTTTDPTAKDVHKQQGNIRSSEDKFIKEDFGGVRKILSSTEDVAHTNSRGNTKTQEHNEMGSEYLKTHPSLTHQAIKSEKKIGGGFEPRVGRVVDGIPDRVDRIKCLGNSVVPQIPYLIGLSILQAINK